MNMVPHIFLRIVSPFFQLFALLCSSSPRVPFPDAMVATPVVIPRQLSAREDVNLDEGSWGSMQIATPAIVGVGILLIFGAFILWQRRATCDRPYTKYRQVQNDWITKVERMFPWRTQQGVRHSSVLTIADSMRTPSGSTVDPRRVHRSDSSDSRTPLTTTTDDPVYPPKHKFSDSPTLIPKRHYTLNWWWPFRSQPREVKSEEPNSRWRVDDPDGSSSGHGSHGHEESHARYNGGLGDVEVDGVIRIGRDFNSIPSTPLTQPERFIEYARPVRGMSPVAEHLYHPVRTLASATNAIQSRPGTPLSSANRGLPPSHNLSQNNPYVQYPPAENVFRFACAEPPHVAAPLPGYSAVYYSSPRGLHGRDLSSDSIVMAAQQPMAVATSLY